MTPGKALRVLLCALAVTSTATLAHPVSASTWRVGPTSRSQAPSETVPATAGTTGLATGGDSTGARARTAAAAIKAARRAGPVAAPTASAGGFGMFEDLQYLTGAALSARLDAYRATGVTWARFQLIWNAVQRGGLGSYDWAPYDALVDGLIVRGIRPLAVLTTTPSWARPPGCTDLTCGPADAAQYAAFAHTVAERYSGRIAAMELWNEPNSSVFFKPSPDPARYAALVKAAYPAIKAAASGMTVLTGGLAPAVDVRGTNGWATLAPLSFLSSVYAQGAGGSFDAVGWHPYCYPALPGTVDPGNAWYQMYGPKTSVRSLMAAHGDSAKQIWATEMGAHTDPVGQGALSEQGQAETVSRAVTLWSGYPWAGPLFVYQLQDRGTSTSDRENFFGLLRFDGTPKPAYAAWLTAIASHRA